MPQLQRQASYFVGLCFASLVSLCTLNRCRRTSHRVIRSHAELEELKHAIEAKEEETLSLQQKISDIRSEAAAKQEELQQEVNRAQTRSLELQTQLDIANDHIKSLTDSSNRNAKEKSILEDEIRQTKSRHAQTLALLETRTLELKGAQMYLTTADALSGADVIKMMEGLNTEILQTAAFVADSFEFGESKTEEEAEMDNERKQLVDILGDRMVNLLSSKDHSEDPVLIQIALQACMAACSMWLISSWYLNYPESDQLLSRIYSQIRDGEEQAVAGRWRALTRSYAGNLHSSETGWISYTMNGLVGILLVSGCKGSHTELNETITTKFAERIQGVAKMALRLSKAIGEETISSDIEAFQAAPEEQFDPLIMEDTFAQEAVKGALKSGAAEPRASYVLCTTDLGLIRAQRVTGTREWRSMVLLKTKVVIESSLGEI